MPVSVGFATLVMDLMHATSFSCCLNLCGSTFWSMALYMQRHFLDACICEGQQLCVGPYTFRLIFLMPVSVWVSTIAYDLMQLRFLDVCICVGRHFCVGSIHVASPP
jgi:hypothetical protein